MALVTVVRSLVGITLELPGPIFIRPWHYVELEAMSDDMVLRLKELRASRVVDLGQVLDGSPLTKIRI